MNLEAFMYLEEKSTLSFTAGSEHSNSISEQTMFVQLNGKKKEIKQGGEVVSFNSRVT